MGLGNRISAYADREPRKSAVLALVLLMVPLLVLFVGWFLWAVREFFETTPSYDYYFWLALIVGGGATYFVAAATVDLLRKRLWPARQDEREIQ